MKQLISGCDAIFGMQETATNNELIQSDPSN